MVDKVTTVPKTKVGAYVGRLADEDVVRLNRAVLVFPGNCWPHRQRTMRNLHGWKVVRGF